MDNSKVARELIKVSRLLEGKKVPFDEAKINGFRKDFLTLMKNTKRADTYEKALTWTEGFKKWRKSFEDYLYKYLVNDLDNLGWSGNADKGMVGYWKDKVRKDTWGFVIEAVPYLDRDTYKSKELRFYEFQKELPKWEKRVRRKSRVAWKVLKDLVDWYKQVSGETFSVNEPMYEEARIVGFDVVFDGVETEDSFGGYVEVLQAGLKEYRASASKVLPILLKMKLPIVIDLGESDKGGEYMGREVRLSTFALELPKRLVRILSHEMGHHIYRKYLTSEKREVWSRFIKGDYGTLDLLDLANRMGKEKIYGNERLRDRDPITYLQVMGLEFMPEMDFNYNWFYSGDDLKEAIELGKILEKVSVHVNQISAYGNKNPDEAFCEAIGMLVAYGPATVLESVREMLKQIIPIKV